MLLSISEIWSTIMAFRYNGVVRYHSINKHGMWEFLIIEPETNTVLYESSGIKNKS